MIAQMHPAPDGGAEQNQGKIGEQQKGRVHCGILGEAADPTLLWIATRQPAIDWAAKRPISASP
jgi:hypothetical protein